MPNLSTLLAELTTVRLEGNPNVSLDGIAYDSRIVQPGDLFVCLPGFATDGHLYAADALSRGAAALVCEAGSTVPLPPLGDAPRVVVEDTRRALADLSCAFFEHPSRQLKLFGVTGTNGKTTTAAMVARLFETADVPAASIGTLGVRTSAATTQLSRTTPEAPDLQRALRDLLDDGVRVAAIEVSSHALLLQRVRGCAFDGAVFTNLTQDHLDFHETLDDYFAAKALLFTDCAMASDEHKAFAGVVNTDDPAGRKLAALCPGPVLTYGLEGEPHLRADDVAITRQGASYLARYNDREVPVKLSLTGRFNVYNSLAAAGVGLVSGLDLETIKLGLESLDRLDGRLELVEEGQDFALAVDYAHTPGGLRSVIATVREITAGRVITVFGCGGARDRTKRPQMGALAAAASDLCLITSDNPRTEDPKAIIEDILSGIEDRANCEVVVDRQQAIERAVALAEPDDFVLLAGKGHETYQLFADRTIHFDDREVAREALRRRLRA